MGWFFQLLLSEVIGFSHTYTVTGFWAHFVWAVPRFVVFVLIPSVQKHKNVRKIPKVWQIYSETAQQAGVEASWNGSFGGQTSHKKIFYFKVAPSKGFGKRFPFGLFERYKL